ncbi:MAG: response regulator [Bacteroidetes bacterium]|nr:response regulator [Bacteroidota bacterium]
MKRKPTIFGRKNNLASSLFDEDDIEVMQPPKKILVIDDELDICLLLSGYLKKAGHEVVYTTSLQSGIEIAKQIKPSTVFLDHNLPDGLGIPYINKFKELQCEVFIISALSNLKDEAMKNGANYFFEKPLSLASIKKAVEK